jgi:hypothetical protein
MHWLSFLFSTPNTVEDLVKQKAGDFRHIFSLPVIVAALGYFVDIYDLVLFSIVRVPSLQALGLSGRDVTDYGVFLLNMQMAGMLLGGIIWGVLGDRKGRLKIMFGSIFLYSLANIANGMVTSLPAYAALRFIAGVGLAGELGGHDPRSRGPAYQRQGLWHHARGLGGRYRRHTREHHREQL